jgi:DNA-binding response OmpR family regulator
LRVQLCQNIRADVRGGAIYVILLTRRGAYHQILEGMGAGADDYLIKPLDPEQLQVRLIAAARVTSLTVNSTSEPSCKASTRSSPLSPEATR